MEAAAKALTDRMIRYFGWPEERRDVLVFGLTYLFLYLLDIPGILLAGLLSGALGLTVTAALTSALFRLATGGAHFSSLLLCSVFSYGMMGVLGALAAFLGRTLTLRPVAGFLALAALSAAAAIQAYAPVDTPAKPIPPPQRIRLRRASWQLLASWVLFAGWTLSRGYPGVAIASGLGLIFQTMTLTPGGAALYRYIDRLSKRSGCQQKH